MSSKVINKFIKMVKVQCERCYRITWIPEEELPTDSPNKEVAARFDVLENAIANGDKK